MSTIRKPIPIKAAISDLQKQASEAISIEIISNQPTQFKRAMVQDMTKEVTTLCKDHDVLILIAKK
jgi:hypothetical protein